MCSEKANFIEVRLFKLEIPGHVPNSIMLSVHPLRLMNVLNTFNCILPIRFEYICVLSTFAQYGNFDLVVLYRKSRAS